MSLTGLDNPRTTAMSLLIGRCSDLLMSSCMQSWVRKKNPLGCTLVAWLEVIIDERVKIMKWPVLID
jgi:hypothetical protein